MHMPLPPAGCRIKKPTTRANYMVGFFIQPSSWTEASSNNTEWYTTPFHKLHHGSNLNRRKRIHITHRRCVVV